MINGPYYIITIFNTHTCTSLNNTNKRCSQRICSSGFDKCSRHRGPTPLQPLKGACLGICFSCFLRGGGRCCAEAKAALRLHRKLDGRSSRREEGGAIGVRHSSGKAARSVRRLPTRSFHPSGPAPVGTLMPSACGTPFRYTPPSAVDRLIDVPVGVLLLDLLS